MIYVDASVAIAELLAEDRHPPASLWEEVLYSSRLLEYEVWTRINGRGLAQERGEAVQELLGRVWLIELSPFVLSRALEPFPAPVRALDGLHLASVSYLHDQRIKVQVLSYDRRMNAAARAMGFELREI